MCGTRAGGLKARDTNRKLYGADFYSRMGRKGGANGHTGGFASDVMCHCDLLPFPHLVKYCAGKKGGKISRRGPAKNKLSERKYEC